MKGDIMHMKGCDIMSPREKEFTERINVFFTPEQMEQVKREANDVGLTISAYVRMAVMERKKLQRKADLWEEYSSGYDR